MGWRGAADTVMLLHAGFILFVVAGGFLAWRWSRLVAVHLPVLAYGVVIELVGFRCPLTPLEKSLRRRAGATGYEGGFVEHYVVPIVYPGEFTFGTKLVLVALLVAVNMLAYGGLIVRHRRGAGSSARERPGRAGITPERTAPPAPAAGKRAG